MPGRARDCTAKRERARVDRELQRLRRMVEDYQRQRRGRPPGRAEAVPSGLEPLDHALPHGGLPTGAVTEILFGAGGVGATRLALSTAHRAAGEARAVVVVDTTGDFYPPAAADIGISPERLLVIRTRRTADALWATDQSLRCPAVGAVVARLERLRPPESRRLQLAAEDGGTLGLILKPAAARERTFAAVQLRIEPVAADERDNSARPGASGAGESEGSIRLCRITVLKVREGKPVEPFIVGLDDEAGFVPLPPAALARASGDRRGRIGA